MPLPAQKKVFQRERGNFQGCVGELKLSEIGQIIFNALVLVKRDIQAFVFMQTLKKIAGKGTHMDIVQWKFENNIAGKQKELRSPVAYWTCPLVHY